MQIKKEKIKNIDENELDNVVWRYLTFPKFISLLAYGALWFSKLNILQDKYEGTMPTPTEEYVQESYQKWKTVFPPHLHDQIDGMAKVNIEDGRELTVVNCWFLGAEESQTMWDEYVKSNVGLAVKSTIRKLATHVYVEPQFSYIGKVKYVDFESHKMSSYEANQADERAFLKREKFAHEQEIRISSMNIKTLGCVGMNGIPYTQQDIAGKNMNNYENDGLYISVNLQELIDAIVLAPNATECFELLIKRIMQLSSLAITIKRSGLEKINA